MNNRLETEWYPYQAFMGEDGTSEKYSITITFKTDSGKSVEFHIPRGSGAMVTVGRTVEWEGDISMSSLPRKVNESYDFSLEFDATAPDDPRGSYFSVKQEGLDSVPRF